MYRCELCNVNLLKRNKTKHNQTKKHEYYSNLILNRYVINNVEVIKFKDVIDPYFVAHSKKFNFFEVCVSLRFVIELIPTFYDDPYTISVSNNVTYNIQSEHYTTSTTISASEFLLMVIGIYLSHKCSPKIIHKLEIVFILFKKHNYTTLFRTTKINALS